MFSPFSLPSLLILFLIVESGPICGQEVNRSVFSSAYQTTELRGEWVLGETMIGDYQGLSARLSSGFLVGKLKIIGTSTSNYSDFPLEVFPNPFSEQIEIRHSFPGPITVSLRDMPGRLVLYQKFHSQKIILPLAELPEGLYTINYFTADQDRGSCLIIKMK